MSAIRLVLGCRSNQWEDCRLGPRSVCTAAELRAVDLSSSHQFEEEIGTSSSENGLFIPKMEFSVRTPIVQARCESRDLLIGLCGAGLTQAPGLPPLTYELVEP